ncbi:hypothetical protein O3P69_000397 [Scylla paramamosain]|uniref:Uncharacterized protein n=1 Tax=Scylla paramamosain TaxID=85552 RepID=A0AAW0USW2_SCYPA
MNRVRLFLPPWTRALTGAWTRVQAGIRELDPRVAWDPITSRDSITAGTQSIGRDPRAAWDPINSRNSITARTRVPVGIHERPGIQLPAGTGVPPGHEHCVDLSLSLSLSLSSE